MCAGGVTNLIDESRHDPQAGELGREVLDTLGACNQVEEENVFFGNAPGLENLNRHGSRATCISALDGLRHE